jgi:hypothetical protein
MESKQEQSRKINIAWVCRDGYLDLFPLISKELEQDFVFNSFIVTHLKKDETYLKKKYNFKNVEVLSQKINTLLNDGKNFSDEELYKLSKNYNEISMNKVLWSTLFENNIKRKKLNSLAISHIKFWEDFLIKNEIDVLVYERPSILSSCIAWLVCQSLGIKCIDFVDTALDTMTVVDNFNGEYSKNLLKALESISKNNQIEKSESFFKASKYLERINSDPKKTIESLKQQKITDSRAKLNFKKFLGFFELLKEHYKLKEYYLYDSSLLRKISINILYILRFFIHKFVFLYDRVSSTPKEKYFLYPLFMKGEYSNHIFMNPGYCDPIGEIKKIAMCLPPDHFLYVKEHYSGYPNREIKDILKIKEIDKVKFLSPKMNPFNLVKNSLGVITPGSTMGFEAILMSKPVFLLGEPWYKNLPGVKRVSSVEEISKSFSKISEYVPLDEKQKLSIVQAIFLISSEGVKLPRKETLSKKNVINLTNLLKEYLHKSLIINEI